MPFNQASFFRQYRRKIEARVNLLRHQFADYVASIKIDPSSVSLPVDILFDVVRNYFVDLDRTKDFHKIRNADAIKIAAYETYWIARTKPIQVLAVDKKEPQKHLLINEYFAVHTLICQLYHNKEFTSVDVQAWNELFLDHFIYHLHFRHLDAQALELALVALQTEEVFARRTNTKHRKT